MGTVWRATDLVLRRSVAVKEARPADPGLAEWDPEAARLLCERVLREARAPARVDHPNVVTIHHIVDGGPGTLPVDRHGTRERRRTTAEDPGERTRCAQPVRVRTGVPARQAAMSSTASR